MTDRVYDVLFLCTGNSARSIMAEGALAHWGAGRFRSFSAGSHPQPGPHPLAVAELESRGFDTAGLRSKGWEEFSGPDAATLDIVFTVCDRARGESCPIWPGAPLTVHWGVDDPAAAEGSEEERREVFRRVYGELEDRIKLLTRLPIDRLDRATLRDRLEAIGRARDGASAG